MSTTIEGSFAGIDEIGLELSAEAIEEAFSPFVQRPIETTDPEWRRHMRRRHRKIILKSIRRFTLGWLPSGKRNEEAVIREYSAAWGGADYDRYDIHRPADRYSPFDWRGRHYLANTLGSTRFRQLILIRLIEHLKPAKVLEVGCGDGINLLLLATQFPEVEFTGVELTEVGHERAKRIQTLETLPPEMLDFGPLPAKDAGGHRRVNFVRGSATELDLRDSSQDLVFTVLALEQMERIRNRALGEIARVAARHTFMIEPFRDVNATGWRKWNVYRRDYFRAWIDDLLEFGLRPCWRTTDFPQETHLGSAAVLSEKIGAAIPTA